MSKVAKKEKRIRNFTFLIYEESALPDWKERIDSLALPGFYIYHNRDISEDGTLKKPHYHILFLLDSMHSRKQISDIVKFLGGANGIYKDIVVSLCGLDYYKYIITDSDRVRLVKEMIEFCDENGMYSFADLMDYSKDNNKMWFSALCGFYGRAVREYIKERFWERRESEKERVVFKEDF